MSSVAQIDESAQGQRASGYSCLAFGDQQINLRYPRSLEQDIRLLFGSIRCGENANSKSAKRIAITEQGDGQFLLSGAGASVGGLGRADILNFLIERVVHALIVDMTSAPVLHAGAVMRHGRSLLVAGASGTGKSSLVAWLVDRGCSYLTDEACVVDNANRSILGLARALLVKAGALDSVECLDSFREAPRVPVGADIAFAPGTMAAHAPLTCGMIILPQFVTGSPLEITSHTPADAAFLLMACNLNARNLPDGGLHAIAALSRGAPCITLKYGDYGQLDGVLDVLSELILQKQLDASAGRRLLTAFVPSTAPVPAAPAPAVLPKPNCAIQTATPRRPARKLTIGMATYDDYDGVYFSIQALRLYHPEILDEAELLVIDNHPDGLCAAALKQLDEKIANYRYVPYTSETGTASPRNMVFEEATGEFVLCMDSHVMFEAGGLKRLLSYLDANPHTNDLLQGPLIYDDLRTFATHFHPAWRKGMFGYWQKDDRAAGSDAQPFEIPMQGLGVFACRREVWPGFNPRFRGFGGEEGYIHEKFRRAGGRVLCLPFLRWIHRFDRPLGVPYRNKWEDRIRNYIIGFQEVGFSTTELEAHFRELLGDAADAIFRDVFQEQVRKPPPDQAV